MLGAVQAVWTILIGAAMLISGGWFTLDALRSGYVEIGGGARGSWGAEWPKQPVQFGCLTLIWLALAVLGLVFTVGGLIELEAREGPTVVALILLPWAGYNCWYRIGGPAPAYLEQAKVALTRGDDAAVQRLAGQIPSAALCQLIGKAAQLTLPEQPPAPQLAGYREPAKPDDTLLRVAREQLDVEATRQLRRLTAGWAPALAALLPLPVLLYDAATLAGGESGLVFAAVLLAAFAFASRHAWRARKLLLRAPSALAAAAVEGAQRRAEAPSKDSS